MQPSQRLELNPSQTQAAQPTTEITIKLTPFDRKEYRALIEAREQTLRRIVKRLKPALGLSTAVDVGCGVGFFSQTLAKWGLNTCGFDARAENVEEARRRFESMCLPEERCSLFLRQEPQQEDQSLTEMACYPSESSLVKMLYRAGFAKVYRVTPLPGVPLQAAAASLGWASELGRKCTERTGPPAQQRV